MYGVVTKFVRNVRAGQFFRRTRSGNAQYLYSLSTFPWIFIAAFDFFKITDKTFLEGGGLEKSNDGSNR